jgi:ATP-binding cassette subfamily F protein uup
MLTGALAPDSGTVKLGSTLAMAALDQHRDSLDPDTTVADALTGGGSETIMVGGQPRHVIGYMKDFLFTPEQARTPLGKLSGGERGRLMLAQVLAKPSNVLVLDEPTNDLDLETLDLLEEMVADYPGTVLAVSHDRDFLDRVATSVLVAEGEGRFIEYAGGYTDMIAQRGNGVTAKVPVKPAPGPSRPKQRKSAGAKRKLSFAEKHALETLPKRMTALAARIADLKSQLADSTLYARDQKRFLALTSELQEAERELAAAEERWLELEILREEIEGS